MIDRLFEFWDRFKIYALPFLAVVLGLLVTVALYWQLQKIDEKKINEQFSQIAQKQSRHLQWNLTHYRNALHSTVDLFNSTERVGLEDFRRIANLIQNRYPEVLALEWLPKVSRERRDTFVRTMRRQYDLDYQIVELDSDGHLMRAKERSTYYPVTYMQVLPSASHHQSFLGFDHFSRVNRRRAIRKARNQGSITITPSTRLYGTAEDNRNVRSPRNNLGVILYKPVFETKSDRDPGESEEKRPERPTGIISLSLEVQSVMGPVFESEDFDHNVAVFEHPSDQSNPRARLIYTNRSPERVRKMTRREEGVDFRKRFPVLDRSWSVLLWPTADYLSHRRSWAPLAALAFGLLLTGVMAQGAYWLSAELFGRRREFYSVIDSADDAIISTDEHGRVRLWNAAACDIFGYDQSEVLGSSVSRILIEDDRPKFQSEFERSREEDGQIHTRREMMELEGRRADGSTFPIELTVARWEQQGRPFFTIIARDITERQQRARRLEQLTRNLEEQVKKRTEELEQFVYAASHDLREPARVMQTYAGFLEEDLEDTLDSAVQQDLDFIRDSAAQMNELIDSLLTLSRIGQEEINREEVDINVCVDQALEQQEELLEVSEVTVQRDKLPRVKADPALLTDLYQNLLSNSIRHGGNGSVQVTLTAEREDRNWILGVRDDGPGIPPEHQQTIFEPFNHLQQSDGRNGAGIGLSICRRIVDRHDGTIWVESEPGDGAHFRFVLGRPSV